MIGLELTQTGAILLLLTYLPAFGLLAARLRANVPERLPDKSYTPAIVGRVFFAVMLSLLSTMPSTGVARIIAPVMDIAAIPGRGYYIVSLVLDFIMLALLWRMEFYTSAKIVIFNLPSIPFLTAIATGVAYVEQEATVRRVESDVLTRIEGVTIGHAVDVVRTIQKPVTGREDTRIAKHYDIRPLPRPIPVKYSPTIPENDGVVFNPHLLIAGASGAGKTTTIYHLLTELHDRGYRVMLVDVKGDFTHALNSQKWFNDGKALLFDVSRTGIDPFRPIHGSERNSDMIEDLMDSISVLEEVGSKQTHFLRTVFSEMIGNGGQPTYEEFTRRLDGFRNDLIYGRVSYGPQTRDAILGIIDKCLDLSIVFKKSGVSLSHVGDLLHREKPPIIVLNISQIPEKIRAIVMEFLLRKFSKLMTARGPLAYLSGDPLVLVVDEAYLVAKPIVHRGGVRGDTSRSKLEEIARAGRSYGVALILSTQRIDDIADGIRQNIARWIIFSTSSPRDVEILSRVSPEPFQKIINELQVGEAYIRMPNPRRLSMYKYTTKTSAITDGYIFKMNRRLLKGENREAGELDSRPVCNTCGVVVFQDVWDPCPVCGVVPASKRREEVQLQFAEITLSNGRDLSQPVPTATTAKEEAQLQVTQSRSSIEMIEGARQELVRRLYQENRIRDAEILKAAPLELLVKMYSRATDLEELGRYGLAVIRPDGRIRLTPVTKRLLRLLNGGDLDG